MAIYVWTAHESSTAVRICPVVTGSEPAIAGFTDGGLKTPGRGEIWTRVSAEGQPVLWVGLGSAPADLEAWREAGAVVGKWVRSQGWPLVEWPLPDGDSALFRGLLEGLDYGLYRFEALKAAEFPEPEIHFLGGGWNPETAGEILTSTQAVLAGVRLARDLTNLPGNLKRPGALLENLRFRLAPEGVGVSEISGEGLRRLGAGGLSAVGGASTDPPRFILLHWGPGTPEIGLVGKTITFDSGGISLKPSEGLEAMKADLAGGAAVAGAMLAAARLRLPISVLGVLPTAENLPGGAAYRPGDALNLLGGKSVEVISTDAEGRLALADGLALAARLGARRLLDIATLTGACTVALGRSYAAIFGNQTKWQRQVEAAAERAGEKVWPLPLEPSYRRDLDSHVADLKNSGGRAGGTITAALFLSEFVGERPWVHLDIAGKAFREAPAAHRAAGATGYGVRTLVETLRDLP